MCMNTVLGKITVHHLDCLLVLARSLPWVPEKMPKGTTASSATNCHLSYPEILTYIQGVSNHGICFWFSSACLGPPGFGVCSAVFVPPRVPGWALVLFVCLT